MGTGHRHSIYSCLNRAREPNVRVLCLCVTSRMERWRIVRSIIDFPRSRKGGSLGRLSHHLTDATNVTVVDLTRALCLELGIDAANEFATSLHCAFRYTSSLSVLSASGNSLTSLPAAVDSRYIVATYRATILAKAAFRNPKMVYLKLMEDFVTAETTHGSS